MGTLDLAALFDDLVRVEIHLWDAADRRLRAEHGIPLTWYEPMRAVGSAPRGYRRVNEIAAALSITVGGTSKLVDRIAAAGLLQRSTDPKDRRAARVRLTHAGRTMLQAASRTLDEELAAQLVPILDRERLQRLAADLAQVRTRRSEVAPPPESSEVSR